MRSVLGVHWKDWCWSWNSNTWAKGCEELTHLKRPWCWERLRAGEGDDRGWDGWMHHWLDRHESEWTLGVGYGQGGLACCDSWGRKESDMTEQLNWTEYTHEQSENSPTKIKYNRLIWWTKETISKVKRQPSEWEKIIANKATDKELISKIYISNSYSSIPEK